MVNPDRLKPGDRLLWVCLCEEPYADRWPMTVVVSRVRDNNYTRRVSVLRTADHPDEVVVTEHLFPPDALPDAYREMARQAEVFLTQARRTVDRWGPRAAAWALGLPYEKVPDGGEPVEPEGRRQTPVPLPGRHPGGV